MIPFKDGPFRIAIEKKVPVVPVTMPYNRQILPDDGKYYYRNVIPSTRDDIFSNKVHHMKKECHVLNLKKT